ncbi:MAG: nucleotidyltransferase family protein [Bacteroidia bacterium]
MGLSETYSVIIDYLKPFHPKMIGVFGSYARGENRPNSDIDILIDLQSKISLLQLVRMERELSELIGVKVDLLTSGALKNQKLRDYINKDLQIIYK